MINGCPTVKWISLFLLLVVIVSFNFIPQQTGAQGPSPRAHKISPDLLELAHGESAQRIPVIIQFKDRPGASFDAALSKSGGHIKADLVNFNSRVMELPAPAVEALAARPDVSFVSLDRTNISFGHVSLTTGADAIRT